MKKKARNPLWATAAGVLFFSFMRAIDVIPDWIAIPSILYFVLAPGFTMLRMYLDEQAEQADEIQEQLQQLRGVADDLSDSLERINRMLR